MTAWLLSIARWIAGRERAEWAHAMAVETEAAGQQSTAWALGCVAATLRDRLARERKFLLSIVLMPVGALALTVVLFFVVSWLFFRFGLPGPIYSGVLALAPLPFAYHLGRTRSWRSAVLAVLIGFHLYHGAVLTVTWIQFGKLFIGGPYIYNLPLSLGYGLSFSIWLVGAWLGSRRREAARLADAGQSSSIA